MKKIIIITILTVIAIGIGAFALGSLLQISANADETLNNNETQILTSLKVGKYYLENGTTDDYIEVFEDGTIQVNIDYIECIKAAFPGMLENASPEEYEAYMNVYAESQEFWDTKYYYTLCQYTPTIGFSETPNSEHTGGRVLTYEDENTIIFSEDSGYIYHYQE